MATTAMVTTAASTAESMMTMNQAARLAAWGEGWVIPMVLMKAFAMNWMNFMSLRWPAGEIVAEIVRGRIFSRMDESDAPGVHLYMEDLLVRACRSVGGSIHLNKSE